MSDPIHEDGAQQDELDLILAEWTTPPVSSALREQIIASARSRPRRLTHRWAAAMGIGMAGAMAGAVVAAVVIPSPAAPTLNSDSFYPGATVFGDLDEGSER